MCRLLAEVYIATCDAEIADYVTSIGGRAIMTENTHERASDRTAEALERIEKEESIRVDIAVMIQGDEPMVTPQMIEAAVAPMLTDESVQVVNLMARLRTREEHEDPNEVKVVVNLRNEALYFSREPIPSRKKWDKDLPMMKQVCVIPFRRDFLFLFKRLPSTPLERIESIDMNRILEHGYKVQMVEINETIYSVDTPADLEFVERLMVNDPLLREYRNVQVPKPVE